MFKTPEMLAKRPAVQTEVEDEAPKSLKDFIVHLTRESDDKRGIAPADAARAFRPRRQDDVKGDEPWRKYLRQVRVEAIGLARTGKIDILRKGEPIDPVKPFRGVYRLRAKPAEQVAAPAPADTVAQTPAVDGDEA